MKHTFYFLFAVAVVFCYQIAWADSFEAVVNKPKASVYEEPSEFSKAAGELAKGKRIEVQGKETNSFWQIRTKSGRGLWIKKSDILLNTAAIEKDIAEPPVFSAGPAAKKESSDKKFSYDIGFSAGTYNSVSYSEAEVGLSYHALPFLDWRNAAYVRFQNPTNIYGLDSSLRLVGDFGVGVAGVYAFAGPGYRFASQGSGAPFIEAGAVVRLAGFSLGGGMKRLMYSVSTSGATDDTMYFIILGGGGSF